MHLDAHPAMLRYQGIPINPSLNAAGFKRQPNAQDQRRRTARYSDMARLANPLNLDVGMAKGI